MGARHQGHRAKARLKRPGPSGQLLSARSAKGHERRFGDFRSTSALVTILALKADVAKGSEGPRTGVSST